MVYTSMLWVENSSHIFEVDHFTFRRCGLFRMQLIMMKELMLAHRKVQGQGNIQSSLQDNLKARHFEK